MRHEFWRHGPTGTVYAVELAPDGQPTGVCGPIAKRDQRGPQLAYFIYGSVQVAWLHHQRDQLTPIDPEAERAVERQAWRIGAALAVVTILLGAVIDIRVAGPFLALGVGAMALFPRLLKWGG